MSRWRTEIPDAQYDETGSPWIKKNNLACRYCKIDIVTEENRKRIFKT